MANYTRRIKTEIWMDVKFRRFTPEEKTLYLLLRLGEFTSDSSVFRCPLSDCATLCGIPLEHVKTILKKFAKEGYVYYDYKTEEICVCDYFRLHPPVGGLYYEMFKADLDRIHSRKVIKKLIECAKRYEISPAFFAALQDVAPEIREEDYRIKNLARSIDEYRTAANRGRKKIATKYSTGNNKEEDENEPLF